MSEKRPTSKSQDQTDKRNKLVSLECSNTIDSFRDSSIDSSEPKPDIPEKDRQEFETVLSYNIGNVIGSGANCAVFGGVFGENAVSWVKIDFPERQQCIAGRRFAVKYKDLETQPELNEYYFAQLNLEVETLTLLYNRNIIDIYAYFIIYGKRIYIFMEYADNGTLETYLKKLSDECNSNLVVNEAQCKSWSKQLLEGLRYMYSKNLIHGDLHVGNVLMVTDQQTNNQIVAKLSDFGEVKQMTEIHVRNDINDLTEILQNIISKTHFISVDQKNKANQLYNAMKQRFYSDYDQILLHVWFTTDDT